MMTTKLTLVCCGLSLLLAGPLFASNGYTTTMADEEALRAADRRLAERAEDYRNCRRNIGSPSHLMQPGGQIACPNMASMRGAEAQAQRAEVQALLDALEAGRPVDPSEIDRVLREAQ